MTEYTCRYFKHTRNPHVHECLNKDNLSTRCGYNVGESLTCPLCPGERGLTRDEKKKRLNSDTNVPAVLPEEVMDLRTMQSQGRAVIVQKLNIAKRIDNND